MQDRIYELMVLAEDQQRAVNDLIEALESEAKALSKQRGDEAVEMTQALNALKSSVQEGNNALGRLEKGLKDLTFYFVVTAAFIILVILLVLWKVR